MQITLTSLCIVFLAVVGVRMRQSVRTGDDKKTGRLMASAIAYLAASALLNALARIGPYLISTEQTLSLNNVVMSTIMTVGGLVLATVSVLLFKGKI